MNDAIKLDDIDERFFIHGRMEILDALNELIYRCQPVTVYLCGKNDSVEATLLEARDHHLVFDVGHDTNVHHRISISTALSFCSFPDGVRVQFSTAPAQPTSWDDKSVFRVTLPEKLARVQRQENFRVLIPPDKLLMSKIFSSDGALLGEWPVRDVSVGGLGIALPDKSQLDLGRQAAHITLDLAGYGEIDCAVTLRHATGMMKNETDPNYRLGLSFINLPPTVRVAIQRYITDSEHQRRLSEKPLSANDLD